MSPTAMCLVFVLDAPGRQVLLGTKHHGIGASNIVGLGGHVEPGETPVQAATREAREEAHIQLDVSDLRPAGEVRFRFPAKPAWDQDVTVFTTTTWSGTPRPSDEISPTWHPIDQLPFDAMWDDACHWLPDVLRGEVIDLTVTFHNDNKTVAATS